MPDPTAISKSQLRVEIPATLKQELIDAAGKQGISLTQLVITKLAAE